VPAPSPPPASTAQRVAIVGGGPAGLMAAEVLLQAGLQVDLYDAMPSVGRKFLLAGKGGLNLTHSEPLPAFVGRYGAASGAVGQWLAGFGPDDLRAWAQGLGISTFVGSSGRVFPTEMKAAPLLRAWLHRLRAAGLRLHSRHRWLGWAEPGDGPADPTAAPAVTPAVTPAAAQAHRHGPAPLRLASPSGELQVQADAVLLALGGASWPQLGSDGAWWPVLQGRGVALAKLQPSNCGFDVGWSPYFSQRFAGAPMKTVRLHLDDGQGPAFDRAGEFVITATGIEGSLVYAASARIRECINTHGQATVAVDLLPGRSLAQVSEALAAGRGARSLASHLKTRLGLEGAKAALLRERYSAEALQAVLARQPQALAAELKAWPITLTAARPVAEAISTAGGVCLDAMDSHGMLRALPGVFCAGEMVDWEAPTGGYLLTACLASGRASAQGLLAWLGQAPDRHTG